MDSKVDQASPEPHLQLQMAFLSESPHSEIKPINRIEQSIHNRSALTNFATNLRFMFLMILCIPSLFAFMRLFETETQNLIAEYYPIVINHIKNQVNHIEEFIGFYVKLLHNIIVTVGLSPWVLAPMSQILGLITLIRFSAKKISKSVLLTYLSAHLLSAITFLALIRVLLNNPLFESNMWYEVEFNPRKLCMVLLQSATVVGLLYIYVHWCDFWNIRIVLSVLEKEEEETGIRAYELWDYCGKHRPSKGSEFMCVFVWYGYVLSDPSSAVCFITAFAFLCLGQLAKWIGFVLRFQVTSRLPVINGDAS